MAATLTVLPDSARAEERLLELALQSGFVAGPRVCTLAELERELLRSSVAAGSLPAAPRLALRLAVRGAARRAGAALGPFTAIRNEPAFARALEGLLAALSQGLCEPDELLNCAAALHPDVSERAQALARVVLEARRTLSHAGLADAHRALWSAVEALERGAPLPALVAAASEIVFERILDWTPLRRRLALALATRLSTQARGRVCVRLPWSPGRPELTAALEPTLRAFEALGDSPQRGAAHVDVELSDPMLGSPLQPFLARLFSRAAEPTAAAAQACPISLRSCASPWAQAREAARSCADAAAKGIALDRIGIAARSLAGGIAEDLAAALERLGLPARERRGRPALPAAPISLALGLYELVERNFPQRLLAALISAPLLRILEPRDDLRPHRIARRLREARTRDDGRDDGSADAGGIALRLSRFASRLRAAGVARGAAEQGERDAAEVERVAALVARTIAAVRELPERATLAGHGRALIALLRRWGLHEAVLRPEPKGPARALAAAVGRDAAALDALGRACAELHRAAAALGRADAAVDRGAWAELLRDALADESLTARGARGAAIQLVEVRELPGRSFDHLVLVGLLEGELPARAQPDPLLSDDDKRALNRALGRAVFRTPPPDNQDEAAPLLPPRQAEEPLHFHLALCAARSAVLLWPRADERGREALRSPFADEAIAALGREPERAPLAPIPSVSDCRSGRDLLARTSMEAFADAAWRATPPIADGQTVLLARAVLRSPLAPRLPSLARAAAVERERLKSFASEAPSGRFSGLLQGQALLAATPLLRFDDDAPLSASQLESYATCAFQHFARRLIRVPDVDEELDDVQARERGELIHACLEAFYRRLQLEGRLPLRGGVQREAELATLVEETDAAMDRFAGVQHVGSAAVWRLRRREVHKKLARLLDSERMQEGLPRDFERSFGAKAEAALPPLRLRSPDGSQSISVQGRVDRVDVLPGGRELVIDYKAGNLDGLRRKLRLDTICNPEFQLPLYVAALAQGRPGADVDAAYLSVAGARRTDTLREAVSKKGGDIEALLELDPARRQRLRERVPPPINAADRVWDQVGKMRAGLFPIAPLTCERCDLQAVCRIVALPAEEED